MMRAGRRLDMLVFATIILTVLFFCITPAIFPGFPRPVLADTNITYSQSSPGVLQVHAQTTVTNEGTRGNVVITLKLVNASTQTVKLKSAETVYLQQGEQRTIMRTIRGSIHEPYDIVIDAERK
jgi:hypothetical protein